MCQLWSFLSSPKKKMNFLINILCCGAASGAVAILHVATVCSGLDNDATQKNKKKKIDNSVGTGTPRANHQNDRCMTKAQSRQQQGSCLSSRISASSIFLSTICEYLLMEIYAIILLIFASAVIAIILSCFSFASQVHTEHDFERSDRSLSIRDDAVITATSERPAMTAEDSRRVDYVDYSHAGSSFGSNHGSAVYAAETSNYSGSLSFSASFGNASRNAFHMDGSEQGHSSISDLNDTHGTSYTDDDGEIGSSGECDADKRDNYRSGGSDVE